MLYYEDKREKDFLKNDLKSSGLAITGDLNIVHSIADKMKYNNIETAKKGESIFLEEFNNTIQGNIRRDNNDVRGAVKIR